MTTENISPTSIVGVPGLSIWRGILSEEYLAALKGTKRYKTFQMMRDDAVVGALLDAIRMPLLAAEFTVTAASEEEPDLKAAEFVEQCMNDMTRYSWRQHVLDMLEMIVFGWSASEIVLKKRLGLGKKPGSQFDDGKMGLHILDPRGPETLDEWVMDEDYTVKALKQRDPVSGKVYEIPEWKLVHATWRSRKRSPEGSSPLRSLYQAWYRKVNLEVIEAIGAERDLAGLPKIQLPQGATSEDKTAAETIVRNVRLDEESGIVLPPKPLAGGEGWEFELLASGGKAYNVRDIIKDLNKEILMRFFAQFLFLGMDKVGTQALVKGSHDFFSLALKSVQQELLETWNQQLVPFLFKFNSFPGLSGLPYIDWADPGKADIAGLAGMLGGLVSAGLITPDPEMEDHIRAIAGLPERPEGVGEGPRGPAAPGAPGFFIPQFPTAKFADVRGTTGRRERGNIEKETNEYQAALVKVYDEWAMKVRNLVAKAEAKHRPVADLVAIVDGGMFDLAKQLKEVGRSGLSNAVVTGMQGATPDAMALRLIAEKIEENENYIDDNLIPLVRERLVAQIAELLGQPAEFAMDAVALQAAFDVLRGIVGNYAGGYWSSIFLGAGLAQRQEDSARVEEGKKPRRVKWVLDPNAQHCLPSPGFHGCAELAGEYESWQDMPTVPAGRVSCRGNCRCHIDVKNDQGQWERIA